MLGTAAWCRRPVCQQNMIPRENPMKEIPASIIDHACRTIRVHQQEVLHQQAGTNGHGAPVLNEVRSLSGRVDAFVKDFPKRVYVKKGISYRRLSIALLFYCLTLAGNLWFFNQYTIFDMGKATEIAKIAFRNAPNYAQYGEYVYWALVLAFSLLSMAVSFLGVMVVCLFLSIFRFPWVNSVFEAITTAAGSAGFCWVYFQYMPYLQTQLDKIFA